MTTSSSGRDGSSTNGNCSSGGTGTGTAALQSARAGGVGASSSCRSSISFTATKAATQLLERLRQLYAVLLRPAALLRPLAIGVPLTLLTARCWDPLMGAIGSRWLPPLLLSPAALSTAAASSPPPTPILSQSLLPLFRHRLRCVSPACTPLCCFSTPVSACSNDKPTCRRRCCRQRVWHYSRGWHLHRLLSLHFCLCSCPSLHSSKLLLPPVCCCSAAARQQLQRALRPRPRPLPAHS